MRQLQLFDLSPDAIVVGDMVKVARSSALGEVRELLTVKGKPRAHVRWQDYVKPSEFGPIWAQFVDVAKLRKARDDGWREEVVHWCTGLPDLDAKDPDVGTLAFRVCIRHPNDPEPLTRSEKHALGLGFDKWRTELKGDARRWAARLVRAVRRREAATFNELCLVVTERSYTADVCLGKGPWLGLWLAVGKGLLSWSWQHGVIRFARRPHAPGSTAPWRC